MRIATMIRCCFAGPMIGLSVAATTGCAPEQQSTSSSGPIRRDSAGIDIVENLNLPARESRWVIDAEPVVDIGVRDGAPEYMLNRIRGVMRFAGGRILVAESRAQIRIFSASGQHITTRVIQGQGPEELETMYAVFPYRGDSALRRGGGPASGMEAMIVDSAGVFGRKFQIANVDFATRVQGQRRLAGSATGLQGASSDGSLVLRGSGFTTLRGQNGPLWSFAPHWRLDEHGDFADTLATLRDTDLEEGQTGTAPDVAAYSLPLFGRFAPIVALYDRWMFHGDGDHFEILVFDVSARGEAARTPRRIIRYDLPNRPVGSDERKKRIEVALESDSTAADSTETRTFFEARAVRPSFPAFISMKTDAEGNLWVEHPRMREIAGAPDDPNEQKTWTVFDSSGALVGDVATPSAVEIRQIGRDWILGTWSDADGVEHVRVYRLRKDG